MRGPNLAESIRAAETWGRRCTRSVKAGPPGLSSYGLLIYSPVRPNACGGVGFGSRPRTVWCCVATTYDATMYPNAEEGAAAPAATMSGGGGGYGYEAQGAAPVAAWSTGLFDCFDDVGNCCMTWWFPCVTFGQIAEIVDRGSTSCGASAALYTLIALLSSSGCQCAYSCFYRSKLRAQYGLEESPCADCCVHFFCEWCALCQEYRELNNRGFQMSLGWHANIEKQGRATDTMPPQMHPGMTR